MSFGWGMYDRLQYGKTSVRTEPMHWFALPLSCHGEIILQETEQDHSRQWLCHHWTTSCCQHFRTNVHQLLVTTRRVCLLLTIQVSYSFSLGLRHLVLKGGIALGKKL